MTEQSQQPSAPLQIQKPCPKSWGELTGDDKRRFCSECSLHVHAAAQLTRSDAQALVTNASSRVCMRIQYDPSGAPIFRDSAAGDVATARAKLRPAARLARWALSAAAGVLAACHGSFATPAPIDPTLGPDGGEPPSKMGKVCATELLGDVAVPPGPERMGEAVYVPDSPVAPALDPAPAQDGE